MKSTLGAKELEVMEPEELVFLKTETVLLLTFVTTRSGFPSPSRSHIAIPKVALLSGTDPVVVKSTLEAKDVVSMIPELGKVTLKGAFEYAINPVISATEIGAYVVPIGTVTVSDVELADFTAALTAPK